MGHRSATGRGPAPGLVLTELAAAVAVVALVAVLLVVAASESRRQASLGDNLANLKQFALGTGAYAADNSDLVWGFSWRAGVNYGFGGVASTDLQAAANQAIEIIRRRGNRPDMSTIPGWFPHLYFSHLTLLDYLDTWLPERFIAAPEDWQRILWQQSIVPDPDGFFDLLPDVERPAGYGNVEKRWPYSSSYEMPPAFYSPDARSLSPSYRTVAQLSTNGSYMIDSNTPLGGRRLAEVRHPSQKVMLYEEYQRHFGPRRTFFAYTEARVPMMMTDGSAGVRQTGAAERGFQPNSPLSTFPTRMSYTPSAWQPPTLNGSTSELVQGHYRWTRSGLRGRDFGGPEIPWVD